MARDPSWAGYRRGTRLLTWLLTAVVTLAEMLTWFVTDSLAMLAGAAHLALDLTLSVRAIRASRTDKTAGSRLARRSNAITTILSGLLLGLLTLVFFAVFLRGPHRLVHPLAVEGELLLWVAACGLIASLTCACSATPSSQNRAWGAWLGSIYALALCVLALLLVTIHTHRLDAVVAVLATVLLLPRFFLAVHHC